MSIIKYLLSDAIKRCIFSITTRKGESIKAIDMKRLHKKVDGWAEIKTEKDLHQKGLVRHDIIVDGKRKAHIKLDCGRLVEAKVASTVVE